MKKLVLIIIFGIFSFFFLGILNKANAATSTLVENVSATILFGNLPWTNFYQDFKPDISGYLKQVQYYNRASGPREPGSGEPAHCPDSGFPPPTISLSIYEIPFDQATTSLQILRGTSIEYTGFSNTFDFVTSTPLFSDKFYRVKGNVLSESCGVYVTYSTGNSLNGTANPIIGSFVNMKLSVFGETNPVTEIAKEPVVIVPGIMGTELLREQVGPDDLIWVDINQAALPGRDSFLDVLTLDGNGNSTVPIRTGSIFRGGPFGLRNFYGELIDFFQNNGYEENRDLFTFPYDWRLDINRLTTKLAEQIEEARRVARADKVTLVVHSTGGLLTRAYLSQFGDEKVSRVIYLGTPQGGAPKAFNALAFDDVLTNNFIRITGLNRETLHNLAITFPSVFQLLYRQPFVTAINESSTLSLARTYSSEFLESTRYVDLAEGFYRSIMDPPRLPQFNIIGTGVPTLGALDFSTETSATGTLIRDWIPHSTNGDGTVPRVSAESLQGDSVTEIYACGVEHDKLPNSPQVHQLILSVLEDRVVPNFPCRPVEHFVWYSGSPVRTVVQNSDHLVNGLDDQGNIRREIPASDFMVFENNEGGFLPAASSSYSVDITGFEAGLFSFTSHLINLDGNAVGSVVFSDVPITRGSHASFDLTPLSTSSQLTVDIDGDNNVDFIIPANQKLNPKAYIQMVDNVLKTFTLLPGVETSLSAKLRAARRALEIGKVDVALNILRAFVNEIRVQSGKHLTTDQGSILIRFVEHAFQLLGV